MFPGDADMAGAAADLAIRLPDALAPLARLAYNYRWSWAPGGPDLFARIDPRRWRACGLNPVRLLREASPAALERAAADEDLLAEMRALSEVLPDAASGRDTIGSPTEPVVFMCSEFGIHSSLPVYSGGLGILAGDLLKEASDQSVAMVGVGLMYRTGYFHQRIDTSGYQHEYWTDIDPESLPAAVVTGADGGPLLTSIPVFDTELVASVWRIDVGQVPLYLLDTDHEDNPPFGRWVTSRLYDGNRLIRLAQYAVLGVGGVRALRAMGITPSVYHLNEGHPALASWDLFAEQLGTGASPDTAWEAVRSRVVFTTHTPVAAGNETYDRDQVTTVLGRIADLAGGMDALATSGSAPSSDRWGLTPLAIRASRSANGVSRRHGDVARAMWQPLWSDRAVDDVPITAVTNGVHVATWLGAVMRDLLDEHLGRGWIARAEDPAVWAAIDEIPDAELWRARTESRRRLVEHVRTQSVHDRFRRGEEFEYAAAAEHLLSPDVLTLGFARRIASYKRLHLLAADPERALRLLEAPHPVQLFLAGKAHPMDEQAKHIVQELFTLKVAPTVAGRVAFVEDYDLGLAAEFVSGCDVWINLPRPPQEASGTSGMKAAVNGALNLSVLDGWWAEAYDGANGWAIDGTVDGDEGAQDRAHAQALLDHLEQDVVPLFYARDDDGVPSGWVQMIKRSMTTIGPRFSTARMLREYVERIYRR